MPERAQEGPPSGLGEEAVQEWYDATWRWLYRFIYARVQNREEAEDVTQETVLRILRGGRGSGGGGKADAGPSAPSLEEASRFPPSDQLVRTVALNLLRDRWRRHRRKGVVLPLEEALLRGDRAPAAAERGTDAAVVDRVWLEERMQRLPPLYRQVLYWRIIVGLSRAETARQMNRSEAAIRGLQYRALKALRDRLQEVDKG